MHVHSQQWYQAWHCHIFQWKCIQNSQLLSIPSVSPVSLHTQKQLINSRTIWGQFPRNDKLSVAGDSWQSTWASFTSSDSGYVFLHKTTALNLSKYYEVSLPRIYLYKSWMLVAIPYSVVVSIFPGCYKCCSKVWQNLFIVW